VSVFQLAGLASTSLLALALVWSVARGRTRLRTALPWIALWSLTGAAFAWPEATAIAARKLGVRRGADLISYVAILGTLAGFFLMSIRLRQLNRHITILVRELALFEARHEQQEAPESEDARGGPPPELPV